MYLEESRLLFYTYAEANIDSLTLSLEYDSVSVIGEF